MHTPDVDSGSAPAGGASVEVVPPSPQADSLFRLRHLAGVARDRNCRAEPASQGAAYAPLFPEPLDRFVPLHG
jgi:hypothetical protein